MLINQQQHHLSLVLLNELTGCTMSCVLKMKWPMETALLGLALPQVLQEIKEMLIRQGFLVQTMPTPNPVIVAYREGNWYRKSKEIILEISQMENNLTRIDITAIIKNKKEDRHAEELIEENFATSLYHSFKSIIQPHHAI